MLRFSILLLCFKLCFSQPPANYYATATGSGYALKTQLYNIISTDNNVQPYNGMWTFFEIADVLPNGKVWDIYANCNFTFGLPANGGNQDVGTGGNVECEFFNREHTVPNSWYGNQEPMRSDVVHILPVDKKANAERGNLPFGTVNIASYTSSNLSKRGSSSIIGPTGQVFEVINEYKGDIARIFFYMATRYENIIAGWANQSAEAAQMLDGSSNKVFNQWALDMLYQWHLQDEVSLKELNRNNDIYNYQNNRNPFVDNPQWVESIWGNVLSKETTQGFYDLVIYPNPSSQSEVYISTSQPVDAILVYNYQGQKVLEINHPPLINNQYTLKDLDNGFYLVNIKNSQSQSTVKLIRY